jgi:hypothetical protein
MENNYSETPQTGLLLDRQGQEALLGSAKWSLFLAVMGFIGIALMVLVGIFMSVAMSAIPDGLGDNSPFAMIRGYLSIFYIIMAALYFPPVYYLYKYATGMKNGIASQDTVSVSEALVALKSHHKFLGVSIIVIFSLYILFIIGAVAFFAIKVSS